MYPKLDSQALLDALDKPIVIMEYVGESGKYSIRKLTYNALSRTYFLWVCGEIVWRTDDASNAIDAYNTFDDSLTIHWKISHTRESITGQDNGR
jgi:hypothetical protein